nr:hypothetical protein [Polyangiaceae bacterium]
MDDRLMGEVAGAGGQAGFNEEGEAAPAGLAEGGEAAPAGLAEGGEAAPTGPGEGGEAVAVGPLEGGAATSVVHAPAGGAGDAGAGADEGEAFVGGGEEGFDMVLAQRFFEAMRAELEALSPEEVLQLRLDVQKVAAIVMTLAWRDSAPERRAKFERFAAQGNYDISILRRLPSLAQCAWYLRRRQVLAQFAASGAVLSEKESEGAYETRARMIDVIQHWLRDEGDIAVILAQLRQGSGHQVLANDLQTLAELYAREDVVAVIKQDTKHYRASDR